MKNLVENVAEGKEKTAEPVDSVPTSKVKGKVAELANLDWSPLANEKLESHAEEILTGIMARIPGLTVRTSKNNHQVLSFGEGRGRVVAKIWFAKTKVCVETPILEGRSYKVCKSRYLNEKTGLSKKDRASIVKEIKEYIKDRGWEN